MNINLNGKTILITGGSGALGCAVVKELLCANAKTLFTYYHDESTAKELQKEGAIGLRLDLKDRAALAEIRNWVEQADKKVDGLILNAAEAHASPFVKFSEEQWDSIQEVNVRANYFLIKKLLPLLRKANPGKIVSVISRIGLQGALGDAAYAASKAALIGLTRSVAKEVGRMNILVNAFNPGFLNDGMSQEVVEAAKKRAAVESVLNTTANCQEAARFLVYLLSEYVQNVSGQIFHWESRPVF